ALTEQQLTIASSRQDLLALEAECKKALEVLDALRLNLSKDGARYRHFAQQCQHSIVYAQQMTAAALAASGLDMSLIESRTDEGQSLEAMLERSNMLLSAADNLARRCWECVERTGDTCSRTKTKAEDLLCQRTHESEQAAKQLRQQATEVDYTIIMAEKSLSKSSKKLAGKQMARTAKLDRTHVMLEHLRETRQQIQGQIQQKLSMLSIDESCRKVTAQSASALDFDPWTQQSNGRKRPVSAGALSRPASLTSFGAVSEAVQKGLAASLTMPGSRSLPPLAALAGPEASPSTPAIDCDSSASTACTRPMSAAGSRPMSAAGRRGKTGGKLP
ncbi:unnamed protein product, partial [Polarella glacialis]